ncbi:MAG: ATP-binding cassette domain-containing protein [Oscillospiraceae bacterium]|jgi:energy-coupling factor transport system ATP-binding protein
MEAAIRTESLCFSYESTDKGFSISDVSIEIPHGCCCGIIGETGSGKSTLIRHFNGLLRPDSGRVLINGEDINVKGYDRKKVRFTVGLVFQHPEYQLFAETVREDIAFGPRNMGLSDEEIKRRTESAARLMGVEDLLGKSPFELSGGEQKRVSIAGIISMEPDILVLDEPVSGLDPKGRRTVLSWIKDYMKGGDRTVVMVTHSMEDVALTADMSIVMKGGACVYCGSTRSLIEDPEKVSECGLALPAYSQVLFRLRKEGYPVRSIFAADEEEAADAVASLAEGRC